MAQTEKPICTLHRDQAPALHGVKLGMTIEQMLTLFPGSREDSEIRAELARPPRLGMSSFVIRPDAYATKDKFTGIQQITLTFLDGLLSNATVGYRALQWKNVDEFVAKFSEENNLPETESWQPYVGLDDKLKSLKCDGFELSVFAGGKGVDVNYVQVKDLVAEKELRDRRAKAKAKAKAQEQAKQ